MRGEFKDSDLRVGVILPQEGLRHLPGGNLPPSGKQLLQMTKWKQEYSDSLASIYYECKIWRAAKRLTRGLGFDKPIVW